MFRPLFAILALGLGSAAPAAEKPLSVPLTALDGKPTALAAHAGKAATVVVFTSFDCPVSASYLAQLDEFAKTRAEKGVAVVLVSPTDEKRDAVAKAAVGFKLAVPVLLDAKRELAGLPKPRSRRKRSYSIPTARCCTAGASTTAIPRASRRTRPSRPAGKADYAARGGIYLHADAVRHNVLPHMHLLGKSTRVTMTPPGGKPVVLIDIPAWDYRWQETYWFAEPIHAKAGTRLEVTATFDNSAANANNPTKPPRDVPYGEETTDEMLFAFFGATSTTKPWTPIKTYAFPPDGAVATGPIDGKLTPVLEAMVGTWDTTTDFKLAGRTIKLTGKEVAETAFGGTYVRALATSSANERGMILLMTFDPAAKAYRLWMYDSLGTEVAWVGKHDAKANEILWTADIADGVKGAFKWKLAAPGGFTWELVIGPRDKPMMEVSGDRTTKKK